MTRFLVTQFAFLCALCVWQPLHASLIAEWAGDGNTDESVAGRDGTLQNGATFRTGKIGQAFSLDGNNDYISVADNDVWTLGSEFTISLFANFDDVKQQPIGLLPNVFIGHDEGGGEFDKWVLFFDDVPDGSNTGNLVFHINNGASDFLVSPTSFTVTPGQWHHFSVTRSGSTYTFYADGASLGTRTLTRTISNANALLTIGQAEGLGFFDGGLDEIQIYNEALSASQIASIANVPEPASLAIWSVIGGIGLIAGWRRRRKTAE